MGWKKAKTYTMGERDSAASSLASTLQAALEDVSTLTNKKTKQGRKEDFTRHVANTADVQCAKGMGCEERKEDVDDARPADPERVPDCEAHQRQGRT